MSLADDWKAMCARAAAGHYVWGSSEKLAKMWREHIAKLLPLRDRCLHPGRFFESELLPVYRISGDGEPWGYVLYAVCPACKTSWTLEKFLS